MSLAENKFNHDDILIVGDSFCANRVRTTDWPNKLVELLTGISTTSARGKGFSGASWWSTSRELKRQLLISIPKVLIICHTEPNRIPSADNFSLNYSTVFAEGEQFLLHTIGKNFRIIQEAGRYYYKFLHNDEWHRWTETAWYKELDEIIETHNIPYVIHLFCFDDCNTDYKFKRGLTSLEILTSLTESHVYSGKMNHFSQEANISVATAIVDMITNHYQDGVTKDFNLLRLCR